MHAGLGVGRVGAEVVGGGGGRELFGDAGRGRQARLAVAGAGAAVAAGAGWQTCVGVRERGHELVRRVMIQRKREAIVNSWGKLSFISIRKY